MLVRLARLIAFAVLFLLPSQSPAQDFGVRVRAMIGADETSARAAPDGWPALTAEAIAERATQDRAILAELDRIPRYALLGRDQILHELFHRKVEDRLQQLRLRLYLTPFWRDERFGAQDRSPWEVRVAVEELAAPVLAGALRLRKLESFPDYVDGVMALMRLGAEAGMLPARRYAEELLGVPAVDELRLLAAFDRLYEPPEKQPEIREEAARLIRERVLPAIDSFRTFLASEYLPSCPEHMSVSAWPDGAAMFQLLIERATATEMTPEQVHALASREVTRIREEILAMARGLGWQGSIEEFLAAQSGPTAPVDGEQTLDAYRSAVKAQLRELREASSPELYAVTVISPAYVEGWAEYADERGEDLNRPEETDLRLSDLIGQLLRGVRAALETGVHYLGWDTEQALAYITSQTGQEPSAARAELDRAAEPGAQLAHLVGLKRFEGLRGRAEAALGGEFDEGRFHDTLLAWGALPFDLLQERLEACLAEACLTRTGTRR